MVTCNIKRYSKLRGLICEVYGTQAKFAEAMGLSLPVVCRLLNGSREWTRTEMAKAAQLLGIPLTEIHFYFYAD